MRGESKMLLPSPSIERVWHQLALSLLLITVNERGYA